MKKIFFISIAALLIFEILNVYLIMPMPGSQRMNSIDVAYFLYQWRWIFRIIFGAMIVAGLIMSNFKRKWFPLILILFVAVVIYMTNFYMAADHMFYKPQHTLMATVADNKVDTNRLIIGITYKDDARAYPIRLLGYHHQVLDSISGKAVLVTYCTVCRTGRVYEPLVNGKQENFRLVGMDHFNAMFEDLTTKSWWRQATGEAIAGKLKGVRIPEFYSVQTSLIKWLQLHPTTLIMQPDPVYKNEYDTTFKFESGKSTSTLTGTDSLSGKDKSWVIGVKAGKQTKAYDWNKLKKQRLIQYKIGTTPVLIVLADDNKSFFAFERTAENQMFTLKNDTLFADGHQYKINGDGIDTPDNLKKIAAYQEFLHSWKSFNTGTTFY